MSNKLVEHKESKEILTGNQKENFVLDLFHYFKYSFHYSLDKYTFDI